MGRLTSVSSPTEALGHLTESRQWQAAKDFGGGGVGGQARARLSTLSLFNNTKRGGVVFMGVKKIRGDGLVAWRGEAVVVLGGLQALPLTICCPG